MIRYRTGMNRRTGKLLQGYAHVEQSIGVILTTLVGERFMRLSFGSNLVRHLGRNLSVPVVLDIYRDTVRAIHAQEPEYRVSKIQLVKIERTGALGLALLGTYYPEGRFGNYSVSEPASSLFALQGEILGASS